jgi:hypothetical protein
MKALSVTTIILATLSLLSAVGYILAGHYTGHDDSTHTVVLAPGVMQIFVAALLAYAGYNAFKGGPARKVVLGVSWAVFIGFTVYAVTSAQ